MIAGFVMAEGGFSWPVRRSVTALWLWQTTHGFGLALGMPEACLLQCQCLDPMAGIRRRPDTHKDALQRATSVTKRDL